LVLQASAITHYFGSSKGGLVFVKTLARIRVRLEYSLRAHSVTKFSQSAA